MYVLNARFAGVKPRREVDGCLCGQGREGGREGFPITEQSQVIDNKIY